MNENEDKEVVKSKQKLFKMVKRGVYSTVLILTLAFLLPPCIAQALEGNISPSKEGIVVLGAIIGLIALECGIVIWN